MTDRLAGTPHLGAGLRGYCPACGDETLRVVRGEIVCESPGCPDPGMTHSILQDSEVEHIVFVGPEGWTLRHPLRERLNDELLTCGWNDYLATEGRAHSHGTWRISWNLDRNVRQWEKL